MDYSCKIFVWNLIPNEKNNSIFLIFLVDFIKIKIFTDVSNNWNNK